MLDEFARLGHIILGCGLSKQTIDEIRAQYPPPHDFYMVDVALDEAVKSWASLLINTHGTPDLVINNAGVINKNASLWEVSDREFTRVMDVNVRGTANVIRWFAPEMVKRKHGVFVNMSSGWGRSADPEVGPYCASKWAVEGLTQVLAQELPSKMAAVSLNPGAINTEMLQSCFGQSAQNYLSPEQWARRAVPFLLKLGSADNGQQLEIPGA